ncbi:hypothetical protein MA16_Dca007495 [Dendrobium catenatum]|uniref:Uncharacterized protein n=1 Tax=Dendrobium catenatum TaxID=906689 RepID=A0A2I0WBA2_9ASPA|nr:hypothetical protein MA16_Dca007495 [Dendrobium catenatum]
MARSRKRGRLTKGLSSRGGDDNFLFKSNEDSFLSQPIDEAQLIIDYIHGLLEIGHVSHKRKKNIALGHLVTYILKKKYNFVHPGALLELPIYFTDPSFRALFGRDDASEKPKGEGGAPAPAPTRLNQQDAQYQQDIGEKMTTIKVGGRQLSWEAQEASRWVGKKNMQATMCTQRATREGSM